MAGDEDYRSKGFDGLDGDGDHHAYYDHSHDYPDDGGPTAALLFALLPLLGFYNLCSSFLNVVFGLLAIQFNVVDLLSLSVYHL